ncbi:MAG: hypothetical protein NXY57DRAFT_1044380 [Lentinula lateritia]|nr:MAG: hypothetical protein NXY57DRAFT_1044380 [Lentinula lateritia]
MANTWIKSVLVGSISTRPWHWSWVLFSFASGMPCCKVDMGDDGADEKEKLEQVEEEGAVLVARHWVNVSLEGCMGDWRTADGAGVWASGDGFPLRLTLLGEIEALLGQLGKKYSN